MAWLSLANGGTLAMGPASNFLKHLPLTRFSAQLYQCLQSLIPAGAKMVCGTYISD